MAVPLSYNIRNLRVRYTTTIMTALGIGLTVTVLLGILALVNGLQSALQVTGDPLHILAMRQGATSELVSAVTPQQFDTLKFLDGIEQIDGEPAASYELISIVSLNLRGREGDGTTEGNINIRGISPVGMKMRDGLELIEGRWFETGKREVVVGEGVHAIRAGTDIGDKIPFGRGEWEVVGIFRAGQSVHNSEVWADGALATSELGREAVRSVVLVKATDEAGAQALFNRVKEDQRLLLEPRFERDYYADQMSSAGPFQALGLFVAVIMAIGSCFAAMNTMYTAVSRRAAEVGTLRLLGFSRWSIVSSFVFESLVLALLGGLAGILLVLPLNGVQSRIGNQLTFSETTFAFQVTPESIMLGLVFAAVMGVLGGLLPARFAAGKTILNSLRGS